MKKNTIRNPQVFAGDEQLAGGQGMRAAKNTHAQTLRRLVYANMLWENNFYTDGETTARLIEQTIPLVDPIDCYNIAVHARQAQGLRHVPLFMAVVMCDLPTHRPWVADVIEAVCTRADQITELLALYWERQPEKPLRAQIKKGIARAFGRFDEYQLAKYDRSKETVRLRDAMFLTHPKPGKGREQLYTRLADQELATPNTWEVRLSSGEPHEQVWTDLIETGKLGALAFIRNLRNMEQAGVNPMLIEQGIQNLNPRGLVPHQYILAAKNAPRYERHLETLMLRTIRQFKKLPGKTVLIADVSGSMEAKISLKSEATRLHACAGFVTLGVEICENPVVYVTGGDDFERSHASEVVPARSGFGWYERLVEANHRLGGGGIFTRQVLNYTKEKEREADRVIVFSDSQDMDSTNRGLPQPWGKRNYIVDVSSEQRGINYKGRWTAELTGFSDYLLQWIREYESEVIDDQGQ